MRVNKCLGAVAVMLGVACASSLWAKSIERDWALAVVHIANESTGMGGTGFIVSRQTETNVWYVYLVSNKHVLEAKPFNSTPKDGFTTNRNATATVYLNRKGELRPVLTTIKITLRDENTEYVKGHPRAEVDVAALDFTEYISESRMVKSNLDMGMIPEERFLTRDKLKSEYVTIGDRVLVLGYPLNMVEGGHVVPIGRSGCIASLPEVDFRGLPIVLIDAAIVRGSSGSPVIVPTQVGTWKDEHTLDLTGVQQNNLLGVISSTVSDFELVLRKTDAFGAPPSEISVVNTANLGIVFRPETISETIDLLGPKRWKP